jgi:hypothetical protein
MHGADVGVVERRRELRLAQQPSASGAVMQRLGGQHLDGDLAFEPVVARAVHLAHPTRAEGSENLVGGETGTGRQRHWRNLPYR